MEEYRVQGIGVGGDLICPRGNNIEVRVDWVGGIGGVLWEASAWAMRRGWRGYSSFLFKGSIVHLVVAYC